MVENRSGKFRHRKVKFAQISNSALQDARLSLKAKGLYSLVQSYITMENYDLYKWFLLKQCKEGEKAFNSAWKELKDTGYLKQYRLPSGDNGTFCYEYELLDEADLTTLSTVNLNRKGDAINTPETEQSDHTPQKGVYGRNDEKDTQNGDDHPPHLAPYAQSTTCSEHHMLNGGCNSNTEPSNTKLNNIRSISPSPVIDGRTDAIRYELKKQIEYDYFEDNYPDDILGIDTIVNCAVEIVTTPSTKINGVEQTRETLIPYIDRIDSCTIKEFLEHMRSKKMVGVKNINSYWRSALINFLREQELLKLTM